jgi:hypothetical protein
VGVYGGLSSGASVAEPRRNTRNVPDMEVRTRIKPSAGYHTTVLRLPTGRRLALSAYPSTNTTSLATFVHVMPIHSRTAGTSDIQAYISGKLEDPRQALPCLNREPVSKHKEIWRISVTTRTLNITLSREYWTAWFGLSYFLSDGHSCSRAYTGLRLVISGAGIPTCAFRRMLRLAGRIVRQLSEAN